MRFSFYRTSFGTPIGAFRTIFKLCTLFGLPLFPARPGCEIYSELQAFAVPNKDAGRTIKSLRIVYPILPRLWARRISNPVQRLLKVKQNRHWQSVPYVWREQGSTQQQYTSCFPELLLMTTCLSVYILPKKSSRPRSDKPVVTLAVSISSLRYLLSKECRSMSQCPWPPDIALWTLAVLVVHCGRSLRQAAFFLRKEEQACTQYSRNIPPWPYAQVWAPHMFVRARLASV